MVQRAKLSNGYYLLREYDTFVGISEGYFGGVIARSKLNFRHCERSEAIS